MLFYKSAISLLISINNNAIINKRITGKSKMTKNIKKRGRERHLPDSFLKTSLEHKKFGEN